MVFDSLEKDQFRLWSQNRLSTINPWRGQALSINRTASCHILCGSSDGTCSRLKQVKAGETWQCGAYQTGWVFVLAYCLPFCKPLNRCKGWMRGNLVFSPPQVEQSITPTCCASSGAKLCSQISSYIIHAFSFTSALFVCEANLCKPCHFPHTAVFPSTCPFPAASLNVPSGFHILFFVFFHKPTLYSTSLFLHSSSHLLPPAPSPLYTCLPSPPPPAFRPHTLLSR